MAKAIVVQALSALFGADVVALIESAISDVVSATLRGAEKWEYIVKQYHDGTTSNIDKKRSISAAFKVACNARGIDDDSAKSMFYSGTAKAEVALGYKVMPTSTGSKKKTAATVVPAAAGTAPAPGGSNLKALASVRDLMERIAHYQTTIKVSKAAKEAMDGIEAIAKRVESELLEG
jgi:hypothetical protein